LPIDAPMAKTPEPQAEAPVTSPVSRREFIARVGDVALATCLVGSGAGALRLAKPNVEAGSVRQVSLGTPGDFKMGTATWLKEHELFVVRTGDGFGCFSSRCTHLGCTVRRTASGFRCPCHGARFDSMGRVVDGPARRPLAWFAVKVEGDGRLWADLEEPVEVGALTRDLLAATQEPG
jgi:cytochrome b6-f complex iron-sulfur subunit